MFYNYETFSNGYARLVTLVHSLCLILIYSSVEDVKKFLVKVKRGRARRRGRRMFSSQWRNWWSVLRINLPSFSVNTSLLWGIASISFCTVNLGSWPWLRIWKVLSFFFSWKRSWTSYPTNLATSIWLPVLMCHLYVSNLSGHFVGLICILCCSPPDEELS